MKKIIIKSIKAFLRKGKGFFYACSHMPTAWCCGFFKKEDQKLSIIPARSH